MLNKTRKLTIDNANNNTNQYLFSMYNFQGWYQVHIFINQISQ